MTSVHELSNTSRAVLELHWLSLCCQGSGPAQSCFSSSYSTLWLVSKFEASQSHPKNSLPALSFATGSSQPAGSVGWCCLLSTFATCFSCSNTSENHPIPSPKPSQEPLQTLWKLQHPILTCCVAGRSPCPLQQWGPRAARCWSARAAVSERKPLQGPAAREQNRKKTTQTTHKLKILPSQSPLLSAFSGMYHQCLGPWPYNFPSPNHLQNNPHKMKILNPFFSWGLLFTR